MMEGIKVHVKVEEELGDTFELTLNGKEIMQGNSF